MNVTRAAPPNSADSSGDSSKDWGEVEKLFHRVADLPAGDQTREIVAAAAQNSWLRERVLELARADRGVTRESLMHIERATQSMRAEIDASASAPRMPQQIGPYLIKSRIAQGGFGVVYLAEQVHPIRREVALKVVRPGFDIAQVLSRFEAERQTLARLTHPNIARILDAGQTEDERPYFAMEYVAGGRITAYCDERALSIPQRLQLFVAACRAIHHAHQKAIVHRDIKPGNVLVTESDGEPVVKVIDFGIAKVLDASVERGATRQTLGSTVGTPEYMSPEQASSDGGDVDVRSDVYSLGVLLFELVTGLLPHDPETLRSLAPAELYKMIANAETASPTRRLREAGEKAQTLAASRALPHARALRDSVKGDLSAIMQKATAREQGRRYQDAQTLADDVERYLTLRPVMAREPSAAYRVSCFVRRYRTRLVVSTLAMLFTIVTALSVWNSVVSRREAEVRAAKERALAYDQAIDSIAAAGLALEKGDSLTSRERLAAVPMEHRHWEWQVLWGWATRERDFAHVENSGGRMAINRHATRLAVSGSGETMSVISTDTGEVVFSIGTGFWTPGMAWHPTRNDLAVGLTGGIWIGNPDHPENARILSTISAPMALAYSDDGKLLAGLFYRASGGKAVRILDAETGEIVVGLAGSAHMAIAALPGRDVFVWGDVSGDVVAYDVSERREIARVSIANDSVPALAVSPDGKSIAVASQRTLAVLDAESFSVKMRTITSHAAFDVAFDETGTVLFTGGEDSVLHAFSALTGDRLQSISNTQQQTHAIAHDSRHERLYVGGLVSGRITSYSSRLDAAELNPGPGGPLPTAMFVGAVCAVQKAVRRERDWLMDASEVQFFDKDSMRLLRTMPSDWLLAWYSAIAPHPRDADLFWYLQREQAQLLAVSTGEVVASIPVRDADDVQTGPRADVLLIKQSAGGWRVHDVDTGELLADNTSFIGVNVDAMAHDGRLLLCNEFVREGERGTSRLAVTLRETLSGKLLHTLDARAAVRGIFSPDGRVVAPSGDRIRLYDVQTGQLIRECEKSENPGWFMRFTPDGSRIIATTSSAVMGVWDTSTGRRVAQLPMRGLTSMHADGTLAVLGSDRILRFVRPLGDIHDPQAAPRSASDILSAGQQ